MTEHSFEIRIDRDGKVKWLRPDLANDFLRLGAGHRWTVTFTPGPRSLQDNKRMHALFGEFAEKSGYSPAAAKEYLKSLWVENGGGTSDMNWEEAAEFMHFCAAFIAEKFG